MNNLTDPIPVDEVGKYIAVTSGRFDPEKLTLFSIFRDEIFFCRAFFDHYRKLGVEQFLIIDDFSADGTSEFLQGQSDCVVLKPAMSYGQEISILDHDGVVRNARAGTYYKMAIPNYFFQDQFVLYLDADEFLFLTPSQDNLHIVIDRLRAKKVSSVVASIVEFFPENFADLEKPVAADSLEDLLEVYNNFQCEPLIRLVGANGVREINDSTTTRLFKKFDIVFKTVKREKPLPLYRRVTSSFLGREPEPVFERKKFYRKSPKFKTPILHVREDSYLIGTHEGNQTASQNLMLTIAHFVFTSQLRQKIERARLWRSYARKSLKYDSMLKLVDEMEKNDATFTDSKTVRFNGAMQFIKCGLMIDRL